MLARAVPRRAGWTWGHPWGQAGDVEAQLDLLKQMLDLAKRGEELQGISFKQPVRDPRVLDALGKLIQQLPYEPPRSGVTYGIKPLPAAEGALAVAEDESALAVYDHLIATALEGRRFRYARDALLRRLAAKAVLARLPTELADVANLVMPPARER